jgi:hypothetical protein
MTATEGEHPDSGCRPSSQTTGGEDEDQYTFEAYYRIQVLPQVQIVPTVQYIRDPVLNPSVDDLRVTGIRLRATCKAKAPCSSSVSATGGMTATGLEPTDTLTRQRRRMERTGAFRKTEIHRPGEGCAGRPGGRKQLVWRE